METEEFAQSAGFEPERNANAGDRKGNRPGSSSERNGNVKDAHLCSVLTCALDERTDTVRVRRRDGMVCGALVVKVQRGVKTREESDKGRQQYVTDLEVVKSCIIGAN
jgi:hypothetical protein